MQYAGNKLPYKYPAWVTEGRNPPPWICDELRLARTAVACVAEERHANKKRNRTRPDRGDNTGGVVRPVADNTSALGLPRPRARDLIKRIVRSREPE